MNIGIQTDKDDFHYDIHSLVKSFFPDDDVTVFSDADTDKCAVKRDMLIRVEIPSYTDRKAAKDGIKQQLYRELSDYTGHVLPWGMLSGIRPTKIPMKMIEEGRRREDILSYLRDYYFVSEEKAQLALGIAEKEHRILAAGGLGREGYSLYIHVPFCPSICLYCTFSSSPIGLWKDRASEYVDAVIGEMKERHDAIVSGREADSSGAEGELPPGPDAVYIGGGTPTALSPELLDRLLSAVQEIWDLTRCREFTVEAGRPDSFSPEKLAVLKRHGVTRLSVNPQTMNQKTLDYIGRQHTVEQTLDAFRMAREAGFSNINMDMILGLPGETEREVRHTLEEITRLGPDSLTVHSLAIKRASRLMKKIREDRELDPEADRGTFEGLTFENNGELMRLAEDAAEALGMEPYYMYRQKNMRGNLENTGFSRPGSECLYNILIMEEIQSIYAFGAGASTKYVHPGGRIERSVSPKDVKTYLERRHCHGTDS